MSVFATLQDAWGVPTLSRSTPITAPVPPVTAAKSAVSVRAMVVGYLQDVYAQEGPRGVMALMPQPMTAGWAGSALLSPPPPPATPKTQWASVFDLETLLPVLLGALLVLLMM